MRDLSRSRAGTSRGSRPRPHASQRLRNPCPQEAPRLGTSWDRGHTGSAEDPTSRGSSHDGSIDEEDLGSGDGRRARDAARGRVRRARPAGRERLGNGVGVPERVLAQHSATFHDTERVPRSEPGSRGPHPDAHGRARAATGTRAPARRTAAAGRAGPRDRRARPREHGRAGHGAPAAARRPGLLGRGPRRRVRSGYPAGRVGAAEGRGHRSRRPRGSRDAGRARPGCSARRAEHVGPRDRDRHRPPARARGRRRPGHQGLQRLLGQRRAVRGQGADVRRQDPARDVPGGPPGRRELRVEARAGQHVAAQVLHGRDRGARLGLRPAEPCVPRVRARHQRRDELDLGLVGAPPGTTVLVY